MSSVENITKTPQCQYIVPRKKRLCRMTVKPGRRYCGEHDRSEPCDLPSGDTEPDARIPCPLDPKHTCYASKLEKHLKVCNARCDAAPHYIIKGCNSVGVSDDEPRIRLKDVPISKLKAVIGLVEKIYNDVISTSIHDGIEPESSIHPSVLADYNLEGRQHSSRRHLRQTSSLLATLQREGLAIDNTCYVELGAGKGHVSYYLARALQNLPSCSVLLVDRASHRHKQDNKLDPRSHCVHRLRVDINDLVLSEVEHVQRAASVVALSKHLCGVATDLALRCVTAAEVVDKTRGVVMATCCHHRCSADGYVAMDFLQELGITREYFDIVMGIVSWATCGTGYSRERTRDLEHDTKRQKLHDETTENEASDSDNVNNENSNKNNLADNELDCCNNKKEIDLHDFTDCKEKNIKTDRTNVEVVVSNGKNNLTDVKSDVIEVKTHVTDVKTDVTDVQTDVTDVKTDVPGVKTEVTDVKGLGLTFERRTEIGRRAKCILDYGRTVYLKKCGFDAKLCYFVDVNVSQENICIIAKKLK